MQVPRACPWGIPLYPVIPRERLVARWPFLSEPHMDRLIPAINRMRTRCRCGSVEFFLLVRWWRPGGGEGDLQVVDDSINDLIVGDKGEYLHLAATCRTDEWINLVNLLA